MSQKSRDNKNRWRSKSVGFRVSPEEWEQINKLVAISGIQKQEYIINRVLQTDVVVNGNPRTYKALRGELQNVYEQLLRLEKLGEKSSEWLDLIRYIAVILDGLKEGK